MEKLLEYIYIFPWAYNPMEKLKPADSKDGCCAAL